MGSNGEQRGINYPDRYPEPEHVCAFRLPNDLLNTALTLTQRCTDHMSHLHHICLRPRPTSMPQEQSMTISALRFEKDRQADAIRTHQVPSGPSGRSCIPTSDVAAIHGAGVCASDIAHASTMQLPLNLGPGCCRRQRRRRPGWSPTCSGGSLQLVPPSPPAAACRMTR